VPLNQDKRISHRWSWDVSTIFEKSYACAFPSMMEVLPGPILNQLQLPD
jgi:hypothetical protein